MNQLIIGYIYLLLTRESFENNETIYKIGRTQQDSVGRFSDYPKNSKLLLHIRCIDSITLEKHLINLFAQKFMRCDRCKLYGKEYFNGNYHEMTEIILKNINYNCSLQPSFLVQKTINALEEQIITLNDQNNKFKLENDKLRNNTELNIANEKIKDLEHKLLETQLYHDSTKQRFEVYVKELEHKLVQMQIKDKLVDEVDEVDVVDEVDEVDVVDEVANSQVNDCETNINNKKKCDKCDKCFSSKQALKKHNMHHCKGVHNLQCHKCLKEFKTKQGKYQHLKNVTCIPINEYCPNTN